MLTKSDVSRFRNVVVRMGGKKQRTDLVDVSARTVIVTGSAYIFRKEKFLSNAVIGVGAHTLGYLANKTKGLEPTGNILQSVGNGVLAALALNSGRKLGTKLAREEGGLKQPPIKLAQKSLR